MIQPAQKESVLGAWFRQGKAPLLKELLANPIMKEALEIIEGHTEPDDTIIPKLVKDHGVNATTVISLIHATQAGERRVLRVLERLSQPPPESISQMTSLQPFAHIDETYLEPKS